MKATYTWTGTEWAIKISDRKFDKKSKEKALKIFSEAYDEVMEVSKGAQRIGRMLSEDEVISAKQIDILRKM